MCIFYITIIARHCQLGCWSSLIDRACSPLWTEEQRFAPLHNLYN